jgi:hypothetical protein
MANGSLPGRSLFRKLSGFDGVDLQRDVSAVDAALGKCAAREPQARLSRAGPHVAKLLGLVVKAPDRSDTFGDGFAEQRLYHVIEALVAGSENDEVGVQRRTIAKLKALGGKLR